MENSKVKFIQVLFTIYLLLFSSTAFAGSIFLTGHDSDFHATSGNINNNDMGAQNINRAAIGYVMDSAYNTYVQQDISKFLFVERKFATAPTNHDFGVEGIKLSGYDEGTDFEHHDFTTLDSELNLLGTKYSAIVVASNYGGLLSGNELSILNNRSSDIIDFLNSGGGLFAMAESTISPIDPNPQASFYGFLPFVVSSTDLDQTETGNTLTPFGESLGLDETDINGNVSHNIFLDTFDLNIVDLDDEGNIISLAGRIQIQQTIPEPLSLILLITGFISIHIRKRKK